MNRLHFTFKASAIKSGLCCPSSASFSSTSSLWNDIPPCTEKVKDVDSFMYYIGRNMSTIASKIPSWEALFQSKSADLKQLGLNTRQRKYLLLWTERFRQGRELHEIRITKRK